MSELQNLESRIARQRSMLAKGADAYERLHADFAEMTKWKRQLEAENAALKEENERLRLENQQINTAFQGAAKLYQETVFDSVKLKARVAELENALERSQDTRDSEA